MKLLLKWIMWLGIAGLVMTVFVVAPYMKNIKKETFVQVEIVDEYVGTGSMLRPWFVDENGDNISYLTITRLVCNSPAAQAGLKKGDFLIAIQGKSVTGITPQKFYDLLEKEILSLSEGDTVTYTIERKGETFDVDIVLKKLPKIFECE